MQHILVYSDSLSWGIIPGTRQRLPFETRWPGVMELAMSARSGRVRVIEDCLNGRRTVWEDPFKPGRNGVVGLSERIEINSPLALVILMLGTNDFQSMHPHSSWHAAQGIVTLVNVIRQAPIEPGMPIPSILIVSPPPIVDPRGPIAAKFDGAAAKWVGLNTALERVATEMGCRFFDAGRVTSASTVDGIHLDADQHAKLGHAMAEFVATLSLA